MQRAFPGRFHRTMLAFVKEIGVFHGETRARISRPGPPRHGISLLNLVKLQGVAVAVFSCEKIVMISLWVGPRL